MKSKFSSGAILAILALLWLLPAAEALRPVLSKLHEQQFAAFDASLVRPLLNSIAVAIAGAAVWTLCAAPAGYALSRRQFGAGKLFFGVLIGLMFFPPVVLMAPIFVTTARLGIYDSHAALIAPSSLAAFAVVYAAVAARSIPKSVVDAARIDGLGELAIFTRIVIPILRKPLAALFIIVFIGYWGALAWPMAVVDTPENFTLALTHLESSRSNLGNGSVLQSAFVAAAAIPVIVLFLVKPRDIIAGVVNTLANVKH